MSKIWQTSGELDSLIEKFTVGDDYKFDQILLPYDIVGSLAHAKMLAKIWVLSEAELSEIQEWLSEIQELVKTGRFTIQQHDEDCHTAIESYLTEKYGEVWKKIHTGRSRDDQSLTMIRLYMKGIYEESIDKIECLIKTLKKRIWEKDINMPGYTHAQKAMPTSKNTWLGSFHDALCEELIMLRPFWKILDQSPLWSAAWFGIRWFENDRKFSANEMRFSKVQENPMYCGISRGLFEYEFLSLIGNFLMILSRLNNDILLFTTSEFGFLSLPDNMTTGSSIMPQKRNYDVCELVRAKIAIFFGYSDQMRNLYTHLMSGYQRDLQMSKSILIDGYTLWKEIIEIYTLIIESIQFHEKNLQNSLTPDIFLTEKVYKLVKTGIPFREAYKQVKENYFKE